MQTSLPALCIGMVAGQPVGPVLVLVAGLVVAVLIISLTVATVAILSVVLKKDGQRKNGIRVLRELRRMLHLLLSALRDFWTGGRDSTDR